MSVIGVRQLTYSYRTGSASTTVIDVLGGMQSANFSVATQFKHLSLTNFAPSASSLRACHTFQRSTGEVGTTVQRLQRRQHLACSMSDLTWPAERVHAMHCISVLRCSYTFFAPLSTSPFCCSISVQKPGQHTKACVSRPAEVVQQDSTSV